MKRVNFFCSLDDYNVILMDFSDSMPLLGKLLFLIKEKRKANKTADKWKDFMNKSDELCGDDLELQEESGNKPALIEYTGGTTGEPKGVVLSNNNINSVAEQYSKNGTELKRGQIWQCVSAPFIAYVMIVSTHLPLSQGVTCSISMYDPEKNSKSIVKGKYNHIAGNPAVWEKVIQSKAKKSNLSKLVMPISGADSMSETLEKKTNLFLKKCGCKNVICNGYGMTESEAGSCVNLSKTISKMGSVGIPFINTVISVFDETTDKELKYGEIGEICIHGPGVMLGYLNNEKATEEIIKTHKDGKKWLHTGDYGHMDEDGFLFIDGRIKRMIIRENGAKVFPLEIEKEILKIDGVKKCAVIGKKDKMDQIPIGFVVLDKNNNNLNKNEIINHCRNGVQEYSIPDDILFVDKIPLTPIGKVDYRELERLVKAKSNENGEK